MPIFSIITITRNNKAGLEKTCSSVQLQECKDYEWIVVDGASDDGTIEFLKFQTGGIENTLFFSEKDNGIYDAMNKGMRHATGEYLIFMNAGDTFANEQVLSAVSQHLQKKPDFIYGDALEGDSRKLKSARRYRDLPWGMFTHHQAMIYKRDLLVREGLKYSLLYEIAGDYDFTIRFLKAAKSIVYIKIPICVFEEGGVSQRKFAQGRKEQYLIRENVRLVHPVRNSLILLVQMAAWKIKALSPSLYVILKSFVLKHFFEDPSVSKKRKV